MATSIKISDLNFWTVLPSLSISVNDAYCICKKNFLGPGWKMFPRRATAARCLFFKVVYYKSRKVVCDWSNQWLSTLEIFSSENGQICSVAVLNVACQDISTRVIQCLQNQDKMLPRFSRWTRLHCWGGARRKFPKLTLYLRLTVLRGLYFPGHIGSHHLFFW